MKGCLSREARRSGDAIVPKVGLGIAFPPEPERFVGRLQPMPGALFNLMQDIHGWPGRTLGRYHAGMRERSAWCAFPRSSPHRYFVEGVTSSTA